MKIIPEDQVGIMLAGLQLLIAQLEAGTLDDELEDMVCTGRDGPRAMPSRAELAAISERLNTPPTPDDESEF
jgi:hypothetical protein